jgi:hypothetical protein
MKIAITIEPWKLKIFEKILAEDGYNNFEVFETNTITTIKIETDNLFKLQATVKKALHKAHNSRMN